MNTLEFTEPVSIMAASLVYTFNDALKASSSSLNPTIVESQAMLRIKEPQSLSRTHIFIPSPKHILYSADMI
jgi:hypothetical protein